MKMNQVFLKPFTYLVAIALLSGIYAFGYYGGKSSKILQSNTLNTTQAKELADNYSSTAPKIRGVLESIYIDKATLEDMNAVMNVKRSADGLRIYFGRDGSGGNANLVVAVSNNSDDTSFILKSGGIANPCPNACDAQSAIRN
jgi:hypothetical protein